MDLNFLKQDQIEFLRKKNYILEDETPQQRYKAIIDRVREIAEFKYPEGLTDRLQELLDRNILSLSTPTLANFGRKKPSGRNTQPLPVSCNILGIENSIQGIYSSNLEAAMLSKLGAGVGIDFTQVVNEGTKLSEGFHSNSKLDWIEALIDTTQKVSQQGVRRGYGVPFISIEDKEYYKLLKRIDKSNPDENDILVENNVGICIPEGFMEQMLAGNVEFQKRWFELLKVRKKTGNAYVVFLDNMAKNMSPVYSATNQKPTQSNICTEITTPFYSDKTFACVLAALNLNYWDEIEANPQIIKDCFMFLDIVCEEYILLTENVPGLEKSRRSAIEKRDIGLGTLGFHELLQSKGMSFGGLQSKALNKRIYKTIRKYGEEYTSEIGQLLGSPKMCQEASMVRRNVSLMCVAPNKSTSFICNSTSLSVEPFMSNFFVKNLSGIQYVFKNRHLQKILSEKNKDTPEMWEDIASNLGSVQHLDFLSQDQKEVFKTFSEISPKDIIDLAIDRQEYIDMAQSLNIMLRPNYTMKDIHNMHVYAWNPSDGRKGLKTLYYSYPQAHVVLEQEGGAWDTCSSCAD